MSLWTLTVVPGHFYWIHTVEGCDTWAEFGFSLWEGPNPSRPTIQISLISRFSNPAKRLSMVSWGGDGKLLAN